jgi:uncharacterized protein YfaP (DUF2135 family)
LRGGGGSSGGYVEDGTPPNEAPKEGENGGEDSGDGGDDPATPDVNRARLIIESHQSGETVTDRIITLSGRIDSGEARVTRLDILVGDTESPTVFPTVVASNGTFSKTVIPDAGVNQLNFETWAGQINDFVPNDREANPFSLNLELDDSDLAVMQVTLTWDTATDVDLYVIDPTGDYSYYNHKKTASGGELDVDDTDGYGPEHWTLTRSNDIQCGQPYRVRVHYFHAKMTGGGAGFTVKVKLYEGTGQKIERTYPGTLERAAGSLYPASQYLEYTSPTATGEDGWQDIPVVLEDPSVCGM